MPTAVSRIPLERPASIKRLLPSFDDQGWIVGDYVYGDENLQLKYLFDEDTIGKLADISPVVLYGEPGTGKTALAITLAVRWARLTSKRPLCLTNGKSFGTDYATAVEIDDIQSFRERHRKSELLVLDDLQPLVGKGAALAELSSTLDSLREQDVPSIVTVSKLPASITGLPPALSSRLCSGFSMPLMKLCLSSQIEVIKPLVKQIDSSLSATELAEFCRGFDTSLSVGDLRALVVSAHQLKASSGAVGFDKLNAMMKQHLAGGGLNLATISKAVARKMGVKLSDLRGSTRQARVVRARGLAILLARKLTSESLQRIGLFFGGRDHSTVLHACRKTDSLIATDPELARVLNDVQTDLVG